MFVACTLSTRFEKSFVRVGLVLDVMRSTNHVGLCT